VVRLCLRPRRHGKRTAEKRFHDRRGAASEGGRGQGRRGSRRRPRPRKCPAVPGEPPSPRAAVAGPARLASLAILTRCAPKAARCATPTRWALRKAARTSTGRRLYKLVRRCGTRGAGRRPKETSAGAAHRRGTPRSRLCMRSRAAGSRLGAQISSACQGCAPARVAAMCVFGQHARRASGQHVLVGSSSGMTCRNGRARAEAPSASSNHAPPRRRSGRQVEVAVADREQRGREFLAAHGAAALDPASARLRKKRGVIERCETDRFL
jgi:hypothetical protein